MNQKNLKLRQGIHEFSLLEIKKKFCFNPQRQTLFKGLKEVVKNLKSAGIKDIYIDGSFVSDKELPNDIDGCWMPTASMNTKKLDPVLLDFSNGRKKMKEKYGVDFFLANVIEGSSGEPFLEFFQTDRDGNRQGIIKIKFD